MFKISFFLKRSLAFLIFFIEILNLSAAFPKELPEPKILKSPLKSINDLLSKMWVSDHFSVNDPRVEAGVDLGEMEKKQIRNYIDEKSIPNEEKMIVMIRYGMGDEEMVDLFIDAKNKGIAVLFITDLNQYLKADFAEGEKSTVDFSKAKAVGAMGALITRLLAAGFDYNHPKWGVFSQPLLLKIGDSILPIMHEKALLLLAGTFDNAQVLKLIAGTNNITGHARYNRSIEIADENLKKIYLEHIQNLLEAFTQGKNISDIKNVGLLRSAFDDGSYAEMAFTDGQYNPNDRIANIFKEALNSGGKTKVSKVLFSEFVFTHRETSDALVELMKADPDLTISGVFDDRFIDLHGYGQAIRFLGYPLIRDFGGSKIGWGRAISQRSKFWAYQAPAIGPDGKPLHEDSNDGAPTQRKVWHDKTSMIWVEENGVKWVYIFTLSLNLSSHFDNAEAQLMLKLPAESPWVKFFEDSINEVKNSQAEYAIPLELAILRNSLAMVADIRDLEVSVDEAKNASKMLLDRNYSAFKDLLLLLIDRDSTLAKRLEKDELMQRLDRIGAFLDWYMKKVPPSQSYAPQRLQKFALIALLFSDPKLRSGQKVFILRQILWRPGVEDAQLDSWVHEAWVAAALDPNDFPQKPVEDGAGVHTTPKMKILASLSGDEETASQTAEASPEKALKIVMGAAVVEETEVPPLVKTFKSQSKKWASSFYIFDIDDNLFKLPTKIVLFEKNTAREVYVSTEEYARIREKVGKEGLWRHFEIRTADDKTGSFRYFRPADKGNYFLDDIVKAMKESRPESWVGPSFEALLSVLVDPELAKRVYFLTARGHLADEVLEGMDKLLSYFRHKYGLKFYLPPKENIFCIGSAPKPAQAKADRLREIVSKINSIPIDPEAPKVLNAAGTAQESLHLVGFSDDDALNRQLAEETMHRSLTGMPHVKFTLWDSSRHPAVGRVLVPGGGSRPMRKEESSEYISDFEEQIMGAVDEDLISCEKALALGLSQIN